MLAGWIAGNMAGNLRGATERLSLGCDHHGRSDEGGVSLT